MDIIANPDPQALSQRCGILVEEDELGVHLGRPEGMRTRTYITGDWRLTLYDGYDRGEMYDLVNDPDETRNLWGSDDHAGQRAALVEEMLREIIRLGDTAPLTLRVA